MKGRTSSPATTASPRPIASAAAWTAVPRSAAASRRKSGIFFSQSTAAWAPPDTTIRFRTSEIADRAGRRLPFRPADEGRLVLDPEDRRDRRIERSAVPGVAVAGIPDETEVSGKIALAGHDGSLYSVRIVTLEAYYQSSGRAISLCRDGTRRGKDSRAGLAGLSAIPTAGARRGLGNGLGSEGRPPRHDGVELVEQGHRPRQRQPPAPRRRPRRRPVGARRGLRRLGRTAVD